MGSACHGPPYLPIACTRCVDQIVLLLPFLHLVGVGVWLGGFVTIAVVARGLE